MKLGAREKTVLAGVIVFVLGGLGLDLWQTNGGVEQMENFEQILIRRKKNRDRLEKEAPDLFNGFNELMKYYYKESALDLKQKELIAVGVAIATRCIPCLANHANNAITHGATREEVIDAAAIGVEFGGGPAFVAARDNLLEFLDQIEGK